jgi:T-complex protein 1 subunit theta
MIKKASKAKVAVFTCGLDVAQTETKGTVLLKNADEMLNFTTGEEKHMEKVVNSLHINALLSDNSIDHQRDR